MSTDKKEFESKENAIKRVAEHARSKGLTVTLCDCSASLRIENSKGDWIKIEPARQGCGGDERWNVVEWGRFAGVLKSRNALNSALRELAACR